MRITWANWYILSNLFDRHLAPLLKAVLRYRFIVLKKNLEQIEILQLIRIKSQHIDLDFLFIFVFYVPHECMPRKPDKSWNGLTCTSLPRNVKLWVVKSLAVLITASH